MATDKKPPSNRKIIDVSSPDASASDPSSRPLIVTNRPIMKDPMVVEEDNKDESVNLENTAKTDKEALSEKSSKALIEPLATPKLPIETPKQSKSESKDTHNEVSAPKESIEDISAKAKLKAEPSLAKEPVTEEVVKAEATEKESAMVETKENKDEAATEKDETDDETKKDEQSVDEKETAELVKQAEMEETLQKIVDSKKYYLPINTIEKRRTKRFVILGILLSALLVVAWLDIALDAGLISNSINAPHTKFFSSTGPAPASTIGVTSPSTKTINPRAFAASQKFIKATQNKDKAAADSLESTSAKATFLTSFGAASFYDSCLKAGPSCSKYFDSSFINKSIKTYSPYIAQDSSKGQEITYSKKTLVQSVTCTSTSSISLTMDMVGVGNTWQIDNISMHSSASAC